MAQQLGQVSPDGRWLWNGAQWVPHQQPPPGPAGARWARPYESARFRSTLVTIFLVANGLGLIVSLLFDVVDINYAQTPNPSGALALAEALTGLAGFLLFYGILIPAGVFFCIWLHRVVRNMPALGSNDPSWSPAGAVGRCFVPVMNYWHPLVSTLDAWRGSDLAGHFLDAPARKTIRIPPLITGWWGLWIIGGTLTRIASGISPSKDVPTEIIGATVKIGSDVLLFAAALLAILVVRDVTARQDRKHELISSGQLV